MELIQDYAPTDTIKNWAMGCREKCLQELREALKDVCSELLKEESTAQEGPQPEEKEEYDNDHLLSAIEKRRRKRLKLAPEPIAQAGNGNKLE